MRRKRMLIMVIFAVCLICAGAISMEGTAFAKGITKVSQVKKLAKKKVKGAASIKVKQGREDGVLVYKAKLQKGKKEYELVYRASDAKLISEGWEMKKAYLKKGRGKLIGLKKCKDLAQKQVSNGKVVSAAKKRSKGIDVYDIKMSKSSKKYELKYHARTGKLLEYEWELDAKENSKEEFISEEQAKKAALQAAGGGTVVKVKFTADDGIKIYEVDVVNGDYEYEIEIQATTGRVLKIDKERMDSTPGTEDGPETGEEPGQPGGSGQINLEEAKGIAAADAGVDAADASYTKAELDYEDGILVYEIEFFTSSYEYEYDIDASTGEIYSKEKKKIKQNGNSGSNDTDKYIGLEKAKTIAASHAGFSASEIRFKKAKLDNEDGRMIYEVEFIKNGMEYEYEIDAATGNILQFDQEWDD